MTGTLDNITQAVATTSIRTIKKFLPFIIVGEAILAGCEPIIKTENPTIFPTLPNITLIFEPPTPTITATTTSEPTKNPTATPTPTETATLTLLEAFIQQCKGTGTHGIACIYADNTKTGQNLLTLPLPEWGDGTNIPTTMNGAQIWNYPWDENSGTIWILAHNFAGGDKFSSLHGSDVIIYLINTDGSWRKYGVDKQISLYDVFGDGFYFSLLPNHETPIYSEDIIKQYAGEDNLVFQTCIDGGVLLTVAVPLPLPVSTTISKPLLTLLK